MRKLVFASFTIMALLTACKEDKTLKTVPERQGAKGESCLITNDCKSGLVCVGNRCIDEEFGLKASTKTCVYAQCLDTKDCCPAKSKGELANCDNLKSSCDDEKASGDDFGACDFYEEQCGKCKATCTNHTCVTPPSTDPPADECTDDSMCAANGEVCVEGQCVGCGKDADCGTGFICEESFCQRGCIRNEACGALAACKAGRCEARGCENDRECVAFLGGPDAVCGKSGECTIPCDGDVGCTRLGGLYSCVDGYCQDSGCESNSECAAKEGTRPGDPLVLCLDKAEADKVMFGGP